MTEGIGIVTFQNHRAVKGVVETLSWETLVERLHTCTETPCDPCPMFEADGVTRHRCEHKHGPAWSPVVLDGPRANVNVRSVNALVLDLDHVKASDVRPFLAALAPYRHLVHSTHSHRPPADVALRAVIAISHPVPASHWRRFYAAATRLLGLPPGLDARDDPARLFFLPSAPPSRIGRFFRTQGDGEVLDVDRILASAPVATDGPVMSIPRTTTVMAAPEPVQLSAEDFVKALKELRRRYKTSQLPKDVRRLAIIEAALEGRELVPQGQGQDPALVELMGILAFKMPPGTPAACVVPMIDKSIVAMGAGPEGLDFWRRKAAVKFDEAVVRRQARDAADAAIVASFAPSLKGALQRHEQASAPADPAADPDEPAPTPEETGWIRDLIFLPKTDPPALKDCGHNVMVILRDAPEWAGLIRFNEVTKHIELGDGHPLETTPDPDTLACFVAGHLQKRWGVFLGELQVLSCLNAVARLNKYDPLAEYLDGLKWDGVERLDTFLETAAGARVKSEDGADLTEHVRRISRRWFISAAARALRPGCKVDTVLVLEGEQGIRKSTLLGTLAGDFHADTPVNLEDKDSKVLASQNWILEVAELASFRKTDVDALKAFFSGRVDKIRPAYGRAIVEYKRRCVFVGTVNPEGSGYLTDPTGNRRYWPVRVSRIDIPYVRANREQLWAEAACYARQAFAVSDAQGDENVPPHLRWWLDQDEEESAAAEAEDRVQQSPFVDVIRDWFLSQAPEKRPEAVRTHDIAEQVLNAPKDGKLPALTVVIGRALTSLGFVKVRKRVPGQKTIPHLYITPEAIRTATHTPRTRPALALIAGAKP